jgi:hypothetical protein
MFSLKVPRKNLLWKYHFEKSRMVWNNHTIDRDKLVVANLFSISNEKQSFNKINHFIYIHKSKKEKRRNIKVKTQTNL